MKRSRSRTTPALEMIASLIPDYPEEITKPCLIRRSGLPAEHFMDRLDSLTYRYPLAEREASGVIYYCMVRKT